MQDRQSSKEDRDR